MKRFPAACAGSGADEMRYPVAAIPWAFHRMRSPGDAAALSDLVGHVRLAIVNARSDLSRLLVSGDYSGYGNHGGGGGGGGARSGAIPSGVLDLEGMSDAKVRHLINNLASA